MTPAAHMFLYVICIPMKGGNKKLKPEPPA